MRIFICYSTPDRVDALRFKELVESDGHVTWTDLLDIDPAGGLTPQMEQGIVEADVLCPLLSPGAVESPRFRRQFGYAVALGARGPRVVPVILRAVPIPGMLADLPPVDATSGLEDPLVVLQIRRALGAHVEEAVMLDAARRAELSDRAAIDAAERAFPHRRLALDRVSDDPIRSLTVTVDHDTWPGASGGVIEIVLTVDRVQGSLSILLARYVEGRTWRPEDGIDERPAEDFFAATKPRVDARLRWDGRTLRAGTVVDGTDLGERPLEFRFPLPGELPSLRELIERSSRVEVWMHPPQGDEPERVDPALTGLRLRLEVRLRRKEAGIDGLRLWSHHDRIDQVLWQAPTMRVCTGLEREALLSLHHNPPMRASLNAPERRVRIAAAVERGDPIDEADRWAAFTLSAGRAHVPRIRGQHQLAAQCGHEAVGLVADTPPERLAYPNAFRLLVAMRLLVDDLARGGGTREAIAHYSNAVVDLARRLGELHPDEPDYRRALAHNLMQRARCLPDLPSATEDVWGAVSIMEGLVAEDPFDWRVEEARRMSAAAEALLDG